MNRYPQIGVHSPGLSILSTKYIGRAFPRVGGTLSYRIGEELKFGNLSVEDLVEMIRQTAGANK